MAKIPGQNHVLFRLSLGYSISDYRLVILMYPAASKVATLNFFSKLYKGKGLGNASSLEEKV